MSTTPRSTQQAQAPDLRYQARNKIRLVTAASLFDGHDAAINIMRRILQASGAEIIHLAHNRSVREIVDAAIQEDVQGIAVSSYQGGHMEFFKYMHDLLTERGCGHIKIFGGGGGTIIPEEKRELEAYGIARIYHPEDGRQLGLHGMIDDVLAQCDYSPLECGMPRSELAEIAPDNWPGLARVMTLLEAAHTQQSAHATQAPRQYEYQQEWEQLFETLQEAVTARDGDERTTAVLGITGTGGAGKSTLTDELTRRYIRDFGDHHVAVLSVDPTKRKTGGALLGDRIRMNSLSLEGPDIGNVFMRSFATRGSGSELSPALADAIALCKLSGFDLIIVETSGIGQADAAVVDLVDVALYVMTPEFGAQSQLEKIEMIDMADLVVVNKFDRPGAEDALADVQKAYQRAHERFAEDLDKMPVFASMASQFNDRGTNRVYRALLGVLSERCGHRVDGRFTETLPVGLPDRHHIIPPKRVRYLAEIAETVRRYKAYVEKQAKLAGTMWALQKSALHLLGKDATPSFDAALSFDDGDERSVTPLARAYETLHSQLDEQSRELLEKWPAVAENYRAEQFSYQVRGQTYEVDNYQLSLSSQKIPKVALPSYSSWQDQLRWQLLENVPGQFPFTAGVFPFKRSGEDPTRMFAGEGGPFRTNKRFHLLSQHSRAKRLSTAFDSVTLYGEDPDRRPDIWGKVGNSGVSIATVEDMEALYAGFDLTKPTTSVSMTINGPAPAILAFYFATATRQALRRYLAAAGKIEISDEDCLQPDGGGYSFAELRALVTDEEYVKLRDETVAQVRGTVQADILKEDQAQNTCIFSTEFALRMQGDMQQWFIDHGVRNFYSVSISGYHIAEAGANPITQLALTLANGFTFVEYFRARGMDVNDFAPNLSFFFSNGMDPEYAVIGRVARRIWAVAMRELYGANDAQPEAEVSHSDLGPLAARPRDRLQRYPHHAAGAAGDLRQLQQPAHQRLRRSDHHAHRRERAARAGDSADHQQRVRPRAKRKSQPGRVHHRRADRAGRRGGAREFERLSRTAAACSARWSACTSAERSSKRASTTSTANTPGSCRSSASTPSWRPTDRKARPPSS
jgi:methylmalonyl-CoA mutase